MYISCFAIIKVSCNLPSYCPHPKDDGRLYFQSVHTLGGVPGPGPGRGGGGGWVGGPRFRSGGVPGPVPGGSQVQGGYPVSDLGGVASLSKGKIFWHQIWLDTCSDWEKKFLSRDPPLPSKGKIFWHQIWLDTCSDLEKNFWSRDPPPRVKGKIFDTRFGLIHVQTGGKKFCKGTPPSPPVKGKIFDTRFGLIHVQTRKKIFVEGPPPSPSKGKIFWHQIWLDTCSDWEKKFLSRDPPSPRIARTCYGYAAGGMPLAFTQEDFLVCSNIEFQLNDIRYRSSLNYVIKTITFTIYLLSVNKYPMEKAITS